MIICIFHYILNYANFSHKPIFLLGITTLFLLSLLCRGKVSEKNINISGLKSPYHRLVSKKIFILLLEKYFKLWRTWSLRLLAHNFLSHLRFFEVGEIMVLKDWHLMLPRAFPDNFTIDVHFLDEAVV